MRLSRPRGWLGERARLAAPALADWVDEAFEDVDALLWEDEGAVRRRRLREGGRWPGAIFGHPQTHRQLAPTASRRPEAISALCPGASVATVKR